MSRSAMKMTRFFPPTVKVRGCVLGAQLWLMYRPRPPFLVASMDTVASTAAGGRVRV